MQLETTEDTESLFELLHDLDGRLSGVALKEIEPAVYALWKRTEWQPLRVAAAATLLNMGSDMENRYPDLVGTVEEGVKSEEPAVGMRAATAICGLSATARTRPTMLTTLESVIRNPGADIEIRCTALAALVCAWKIPAIRALAESMSQADIPAPLRDEALELLDIWQPAPSVIDLLRDWIGQTRSVPCLVTAEQYVGQHGGAHKPDFNTPLLQGIYDVDEQQQIQWEILQAENGDREMTLTTTSPALLEAVVAVGLQETQTGELLPPMYVAMQSYENEAIGYLRLIDGTDGVPQQLLEVPAAQVTEEMTETLRTSYQTAFQLYPDSLPGWEKWLDDVPKELRPQITGEAEPQGGA
jgi:hypothetical protein